MRGSRWTTAGVVLAIVGIVILALPGTGAEAAGTESPPPSARPTVSPPFDPSQTPVVAPTSTRDAGPVATVAPIAPLAPSAPIASPGSSSRPRPVPIGTLAPVAPPSAAASGDLQPAANEANLPPVAQSWPWLAVSGVPLHFNITATDPDRDVLSLELLDAPVHGVLSGCSPPECVYTPDAGFVGLDSIRWRVSDGPHRSDVGVSSFSVTAERFADPRVPDPWPSDGTVVFVDAAVIVHLVTDAEGNPTHRS